MTVLQNMKPDGNKWVGSIYNARDGRTYTAKISMRGDNTLRVEGCIAGGMLCGGQDWARVAQPTVMAPSAAPAAQPAGVATVAPAAKPADAPAPTQRLEAPAVVQTPPSAVAPDQPSASPVSPTKRKTAKRSGYSADAPQITSDDAESAGRSAADMINRMMVDNGVSGARIDPDQAAIAARSARKIINQLMKDNGFRY
jgi:hypothetical protein